MRKYRREDTRENRDRKWEKERSGAVMSLPL